MRVLKFRQAIYSDDKFDHWHYWGFLPDLSFVGPDSINGLAHALDNSQQFTGLHDKNGKDMDWWEGDLFKHYYCDYPLEIVFEEGCFWFQAVGINVRYSTSSLLWNASEPPKKIGNIHENPELLKEEKPK